MLMSYELPCEFDFLKCRRRFRPDEFETWIIHTVSHFGDTGPPLKASCTICSDTNRIFESPKGPYANWRERMFHIGNHFQEGAVTADMKQDPLIVEYLLKSGIFAPEPQPQSPEGTRRGASFDLQDEVATSNWNLVRSKLKDGEIKSKPASNVPQGGYQSTAPGNDDNRQVCDCEHHTALHAREKYAEARVDPSLEEKMSESESTDELVLLQHTAMSKDKGKAREDTESPDSDADDDDPRDQLRHGSGSVPSTEIQHHTLSGPAKIASSNLPPILRSPLAAMVNQEEVLPVRNIVEPSKHKSILASHLQMRLGVAGRPRAGGVDRIMRDLVSKASTMSLVTSTGSADDTDWEEDSDTEEVKRFKMSSKFAQHARSPSAAQLSPDKVKLVDRLMKEFWPIFNQWATAYTTRRGESSSSVPSLNATSTSKLTATTRGTNSTQGTKRSRDDRDDGDGSNGDGQGTKPPGKSPESPSAGDKDQRFACPYRKHNPRKYCVTDWKLCALTHHKTVARVK